MGKDRGVSCLLGFSIYGCSDEGGEDGDGKEAREWRLPGLLYANDLVLCGESEEELRAMVGWFVEVSEFTHGGVFWMNQVQMG